MGTGDPEARWEAAAQLAAGIEDEGVPRRRRRVLLVLGAVVVSALALGALVALLAPDGESGDTAPSTLRTVVGSGCVAVGVVLIVGAVVQGRRAGHFVSRWRWVASPLSRAQRRTAHRQILGKEPVDYDRLPILRAIAGQNRRAMLFQMPLMTGIVLVNGGNLLTIEDPVARRMVELGLLAVLLALVWSTFTYVRTRRFLEEHSDPQAGQAGSSSHRNVRR